MSIECRQGRIRIRHRTRSGRRSLTIGPDTPENRELAQEKLREPPPEPPRAPLTVERAGRLWLDAQRPFLAPTTAGEYEKDLEAVSGLFAKEVRQVGEMEIKALVASWVQRGLSNRRIRNLLIPLRGLFEHALELEAIEASPVRLSKRILKSGAPSREVADPFTLAELAALQKAGEPWEAALVIFWAFTGLRPSEMYALALEDIDLHSLPRPTAHISRSRTRGIVKSTKNAHSTRAVELLPPAVTALNDFRFGYDDKTFREKIWAPLLKRAQVRYRGPKQMRHTFASMMLTAGEPEMWVAQQMGHKGLNMIHKRYGRWIRANRPDTGSKIMSMLKGHDQNASVHQLKS